MTSHPVLIALLMKPFLLARLSVKCPGCASSASMAPPMAIQAAFPVPFLVRICSRLALLHPHTPDKIKKGFY